VRGYYERWIADKVLPMTRKALARDYRRHLEGRLAAARADPD
jgi:hypothetical protein